jgi:alkylation response protein AidB-like acyl-CoA dehydrogenase
MTEELAQSILASERQRCDAMIAGDLAALDASLATELQFHHATGTVDDKAAFLAKMAAGRIFYTALAWSEERVTSLGPDHALLTGRMTTDVRVEGVEKRLNNRVMTVWTQQAGDWRLLAFQSTPIAG